jgi:Zn ribbon nucleic-acid-binding protein
LGEHSGRYEHVAVAFNAAGFSVFALDHLGHGHSPGKRAFINRFTDLTRGRLGAACPHCKRDARLAGFPRRTQFRWPDCSQCGVKRLSKTTRDLS